MLKNEYDVERIFSYAQALEQTGKQKNMIFCRESTVYILNVDKTTLLRFDLEQDRFPNSFGCFVSDYDSPNFQPDKGGVNFIQKGTEFDRNKRCRVPNQTFEEVEDLFFKFYLPDSFQYFFAFHKDSLNLLDTNLSHVEFVVKNKEISLLQRDIYSGTIIELKRKIKPEGLGLIKSEDILPDKLPPVGIRTNDFISLFTFNDRIKIYIPEQPSYFVIEGIHNNMWGVVASCLYDEIGTLNNLQEEQNGREIKEVRSSEPKIDRENKGKIMRRKC